MANAALRWHYPYAGSNIDPGVSSPGDGRSPIIPARGRGGATSGSGHSRATLCYLVEYEAERWSLNPIGKLADARVSLGWIFKGVGQTVLSSISPTRFRVGSQRGQRISRSSHIKSGTVRPGQRVTRSDSRHWKCTLRLTDK